MQHHSCTLPAIYQLTLCDVSNGESPADHAPTHTILTLGTESLAIKLLASGQPSPASQPIRRRQRCYRENHSI